MTSKQFRRAVRAMVEGGVDFTPVTNTITIKDQSGNPATGVLVKEIGSTEFLGIDALKTSAVDRTKTTGSDGKAKFGDTSSGHYHYFADPASLTSKGYYLPEGSYGTLSNPGKIEIDVYSEGKSRNFTVKKVGSLGFLFKDALGNPISNIPVTIAPGNTGVTGPDGKIEFVQLDAYSKYNPTAAPAGWSIPSMPTNLTPDGKTRTVTLSAPQGQPAPNMLAFNITDPTGSGIQYVDVAISGVGSRKTDAGGNVQFAGLDSTKLYDVSFSKSGFTTPATQKFSPSGVVNPIRLTPTAGAAPTLGSITFDIKDEIGNPIQYVPVTLVGIGTVPSNSSGQAVFTNVPKGQNFGVNATAPGGYTLQNIPANVNVDGSPYNIVFKAAAPQTVKKNLTVKVIDATNKPISGVTATVLGPGGAATSTSKQTDSSGMAVIGPLEVKPWSIKFTKSGYNPSTAILTPGTGTNIVPLTKVPGQPEQELLSEGEKLAGRKLNKDVMVFQVLDLSAYKAGKPAIPIQGAKVQMTNTMKGTPIPGQVGISDPAGLALVGGIDTTKGKWYANISKPGYKDDNLTIGVPGPEKPHKGYLEFVPPPKPGFSVVKLMDKTTGLPILDAKGFVLAPVGEGPTAGRKILATPAGATPNGIVLLQFEAGKTVKATFDIAGYKSVDQNIAFKEKQSPGPDYTIELTKIGAAPGPGAKPSKPSFGCLIGKITDLETGDPIVAAAIAANGAVASTDLSGNYRIPQVRVGEVTVRVTKAGYKPFSRKVTIRASAGITETPGLEGIKGTSSLPTAPPPPPAGAPSTSTTGRASTMAMGGQVAVARSPVQTATAAPETMASATTRRQQIQKQTEPACSILNVRLEKIAAEGVPKTGTLSGTITDSETGAPLSNAVVTIVGATAAITDSSGAYTISNIPTGEKVVAVSKAGYTPLEKRTTISEGSNSLDFSMVSTAVGAPPEVGDEEYPPYYYYPPEREPTEFRIDVGAPVVEVGAPTEITQPQPYTPPIEQKPAYPELPSPVDILLAPLRAFQQAVTEFRPPQ